MIEFMIGNNCAYELLAISAWSNANPYCAPPPDNRTSRPSALKRVFLAMAPSIEILLFSQTISSGSGAL